MARCMEAVRRWLRLAVMAWTNSLYSTWDNQFYPDGIPGAEVMANANASGGLELAKDYFVSFPEGYRAHQIRLEGGDCSTDSFCYPSV